MFSRQQSSGVWLIELLTIRGGAALICSRAECFLQCSGVGLPYFIPGAQRLTSFVLWVKPFVRANVEWSDTGQN